MADNTLIAEPRSETGSRPAGRLRRQGRVPAVVYGLGTESESITVPARELQHMLASETGSNTLFSLHLGGKEQLALARQIQRDPVKGTLVHVDFIRVRADVAVSADIPVNLEGEAEGVKRGGLLEQMLFTVAIEAKPGDIPPMVAYDVTAMEIGDQVHVRDLVAPPGVVITSDPDDIVVSLVAPRVAEAEAAEAAEGEAGAGEGAAPAGPGEASSSGE